LSLNVHWLPLNGHFGDPREVHHGQVDHLGGVDRQRNGLVGDSLAGPRYLLRVEFYLLADFVEVGEAVALFMEEFPVLDLLGVFEAAELEHQGAPCHYASASGEEVPAHDGLEDRRLP